MSDERSERYEEAILSAFSDDTNDIDTDKAADAAMAVADEENASLHAELEENETVMRALRRQRDTAEGTIERVRAVLDERHDHRGVDDLANSLFNALEGES